MLKNLLIEDIYFTITLTLLFLITTFLTARGPLTDKRFKKKWWKKINSRGRIVILVNFFILIIYILQSVNNANWLDLKNMELKKEQDERSEIIQRKVKEETGKIFNSMSIAFANQGIKIDSLQEYVSNQKSISQITNNRIFENEPYFHIKSNALKIGDDGLYYGLYVQDASAANFEAKFKIFVLWSDGNKEIFERPFLTPDFTIPANRELTNLKLVDFKNEDLFVEQFFIQFKGNYSNLDKSKKFPFDYVFSYDKKKKKFLPQFNESKDSVLKFFK
ncbi:hypothetical protein [Flagellimonas iocasae]|uniref:Uncharacterized protein n=1 Tax=Flagellimonas iocasae TaxID=2055905 RepID=A0ABW4XTT2_9FLAO